MKYAILEADHLLAASLDAAILPDWTPNGPVPGSTQQKFKSQGSAQRFLAAHATVYNTFSIQPHLISRPALRILRAQADQAWEAATVAA